MTVGDSWTLHIAKLLDFIGHDSLYNIIYISVKISSSND